MAIMTTWKKRSNHQEMSTIITCLKITSFKTLLGNSQKMRKKFLAHQWTMTKNTPHRKNDTQQKCPRRLRSKGQWNSFKRVRMRMFTQKKRMRMKWLLTELKKIHTLNKCHQETFSSLNSTHLTFQLLSNSQSGFRPKIQGEFCKIQD